jgi:Acetyltransferase (GNAT) family.
MLHFIDFYTSDYKDFAEDLFISAFPENERYPFQIIWLRDRTHFHFDVIVDDETPIAILTTDDFEDFVYVEHFAVAESLRGKGYGSQIFERLLENTSKQIVLEVERPEDETTRARVSFYLNLGMKLNSYNYWQPSYVEKRLILPMRLMTRTTLEQRQYVEIRDALYKRIYQYYGNDTPDQSDFT